MGYKQLLFWLPAALAAVVFISGCNKKGCTDFDAQNYNPEATKDEGCIYDKGATALIEVIDNGSGVGTTTWTKNNIYILRGLVFVNSGQTLTIEPGTIIKGGFGQGPEASALIVTRGGTLNAIGTEDEPIIFTAEDDNVDRPDDLVEGTRGLWGGVVILGNARLNSNPPEQPIEGIDPTEIRGVYGGVDDNDNSGSLSYVSIRYGGTDLGNGNEINGLTLGGVGSGTTIDHVEVIFCNDDGIEFFGGTVNSKYIISAFNGDDSFDTDNGYRGKGQFWFSIQDGIKGDFTGEHSGGAGSLYSNPIIYNSTFIGRGVGDNIPLSSFNQNTQGQYHNSIFVGFGKGAKIGVAGGFSTSYDQFLAGRIKFFTNMFWSVGDNTPASCLVAYAEDSVNSGTLQAAQDTLTSYFGVGLNVVEDPIISISRTKNASLDPMPLNANVLSGGTPPTDGWFTPVVYRGAFDGADNWLKHPWNFLNEGGYLK